jgi:hypothetical protein
MNYSKGITWFNDCRIPFVDEGENTKRKVSGHQKVYGSGEEIHYKLDLNNQSDRDNGRYPANLLCSDDMLNDGSISKSDGRKIYANEDTNIKNNVLNKGWVRTKSDIKDKGTNSRYYDIDAWFNNLINNI